MSAWRAMRTSCSKGEARPEEGSPTSSPVGSLPSGRLRAPVLARPANGDTWRRDILVLVVATLVALAAVSLWGWGHSPYRRYLHHGSPSGNGNTDIAAVGLF